MADRKNCDEKNGENNSQNHLDPATYNMGNIFSTNELFYFIWDENDIKRWILKLFPGLKCFYIYLQSPSALQDLNIEEKLN